MGPEYKMMATLSTFMEDIITSITRSGLHNPVYSRHRGEEGIVVCSSGNT